MNGKKIEKKIILKKNLWSHFGVEKHLYDGPAGNLIQIEEGEKIRRRRGE
jgi:hypothetical protein